jgi:antitoxin (DNA-binding transcriptional repressor) of toxin-antitoxin stability system
VIGIRQLKAYLSQVLRDVRRGEVVLVTDRGQVVAELRPPGPAAGSDAEADRILRRLATLPGLRVGEPPPPAQPSAGYPRSPLRLPAGTALELIADERGEQ